MRRGLTLLEMTVTMVILAIIAAIAVPLMGDDSHGRIGAATILIRDDLEQARFRTVADPENPLAFRIDDDMQGWQLIDPLDSSRTITRDDGSPWVIRSGEGRGIGMLGVQFELSGTRQPTLEFDESGARIGGGPGRGGEEGHETGPLHMTHRPCSGPTRPPTRPLPPPALLI